MKKWTIRDIALYGLFIALTVVATIVVVIPAFFTRGFVNLGDTLVLFSAFLFGGIPGMIIGGIGSALADMVLGYFIYAPITLVVKGIEGLIAGMLFKLVKERRGASIWISYLAVLWMVFGYFLAEAFILYGVEAAIPSVLGNLIQALMGGTAAWILYFLAGERLKKMIYRDDQLHN